MKFEDACGLIYAKGIAGDVQKEIGNEQYLPQSAFNNCFARGKALGFHAETRVDYFKALAILYHRELFHDENHAEERKVLEDKMPQEDKELAYRGVTEYGWWINAPAE